MKETENERIEYCPLCNSKMMDDAYEEIEFLPNGSIKINVIANAWVCSSFCGYYEKL